MKLLGQMRKKEGLANLTHIGIKEIGDDNYLTILFELMTEKWSWKPAMLLAL